MIAHQSRIQFGSGARPARGGQRVRIGTFGLAGVIAMLALLNIVAGAA